MAEESAIKWLEGYPVGQFELLAKGFDNLTAAAGVRDHQKVDWELKSLWANLTGNDPEKAAAAQVMLERIAFDGLVPLSQIVDGIPVRARGDVGNPHGPVSLLMRTLRRFAQPRKDDGDFEEVDALERFTAATGHPIGARFGVTEPVHPAILIIKASPSLGAVILESCDQIVRAENSKAGFSLTSPVFRYALLNADRTNCPAVALRTDARNRLSKMVEDLDLAMAFDLLLLELKLLPTKTAGDELVALSATENLVRLISTCPSLDGKLLDSLVYSLCGLLWQCSANTPGEVGLLALTTLRALLPKISGSLMPFLWLFLGTFLSSCPVRFYEEALGTGFSVFEAMDANVPKIIVFSFIVPLCSIAGRGNRTLQESSVSMASSLFSKIMALRDETSSERISGKPTILPKFSLSNGWLWSSQPIITQLLKALAIFDATTGDAEDLKCFSAFYKAESSCLKSVVFQNLTLGVACGFSGVALGVQQDYLRGVAEFAEKDAPTALRLVPVLLATLNFQSDEMKKEVLDVLPKLAIHKSCVAQVLNVIAALRANDSLKIVALNAMVNAWRVEERCFWQLEVVLADRSPDMDWTLAKALATRVICTLKGRKFGAGLLKPVLEYLESPSAPEVVRLCGLDSALGLCRGGLLELMAIWNILKSIAKSDRRERVLEKVGDLMAFASEMEVETKTTEAFMRKVVEYLWDEALKTNEVFSAAALRALAKFSVKEFRPAVVPLKLKTNLAEIQIIEGSMGLNLDEDIDYLPGECYMRVIDEVNEANVDAFGTFLASVVAQEMKNMGRRAYTMGMSQANRRKTALNVAGEPVKYDYLNEKSVLKYLVNFLLASGKNSLDTELETGKVLVCLKALNQAEFFTATHGLPPLFWPGVLEPLFNRNEKLAVAVVDLTVSLGKHSPSAKVFLSRILLDEGGLQLPEAALLVLAKRFPELAAVADVLGLNLFLERLLADYLQFAPPNEAAFLWLEAIKLALRDTCVTPGAKAALADFLLKLGREFNMNHNATLLEAHRKCLVEIPPDTFLTLCEPPPEASADVFEQAAALRAVMVQRSMELGVTGKTYDSNPLKWLLRIVDWCAEESGASSQRYLELLMEGLRSVKDSDFQSQWLGHQLDLILQAAPGRVDEEVSGKNLTARIDIVARAFIVFAEMEGLLDTLTKDPCVSALEARMEVFCLALVNLATEKQWAACMKKILDIIVAPRVSELLTPVYRRGLARSCIALRSMPEMADEIYWTKVADLDDLREKLA